MIKVHNLSARRKAQWKYNKVLNVLGADLYFKYTISMYPRGYCSGTP